MAKIRSNPVTTVCRDTEGVIECVYIYEEERNRSSSLGTITCSEMVKQNIPAKKVY